MWTICEQLVKLYNSSKSNISEHIKHILEEGELDESSTVRNFRTTANDNKSYNVKYYNFDSDMYKIYDCYLNLFDLLFEKIKEIRTNLNLSQEVFSKILGWSKKSIIKYFLYYHLVKYIKQLIRYFIY